MMRRASNSLNKLVNVFKGNKYDWSYEGECGPQTWEKAFVGARGKQQSPINIETAKAQYDESLNDIPLIIDYDHHSCSQIKNTGHTFQVDGYQKNLSSMNTSVYVYSVGPWPYTPPRWPYTILRKIT